MSLISLHAPLTVPIRGAVKAVLARTPRRVKLLAGGALLLVAGYQLSLAIESPAQSIRGELKAAAEDAAALPWTRSAEEVQLTVGRHFEGRAFRVEPARFPAEVAVVLADLDQETCLEARRVARRIEGDVVIALDGFRSATDCEARNTMTWRILP